MKEILLIARNDGQCSEWLSVFEQEDSLIDYTW